MNFRKQPPPSQPPAQQREMQQVERSDTSSPFWRAASANSQRGQQQSPPLERTYGASYSHLSLDNLNISSDARPRTPPSITRNRSTPPPKANAIVPTPPRRGYTSFLADTNNSWTATQQDEEDADSASSQLRFDSDEDEFGLPSIASMRRNGKRISGQKGKDPGGGLQSSYARNGTSLQPSSTSSSWAIVLDNGDVAEERATIPSYPSASPHGTSTATINKSDAKRLRPQYKEILRDPANSLHLIAHSSASPNASSKEVDAHSARITRINKFKKILQASSIHLPELRNSAWSGLPPEVRAMSWQLLLGYLPTSSERRVATLERKRKDYLEGIRVAFASADGPINQAVTNGTSHRDRGRGLDEAIWHQISIDVPRTNPSIPLYQYATTQRSLERILYLWAIRHPASGYVQGINDLVTPFFQVFLAAYITPSPSSGSANVESGVDPGMLPKPVLDAVEADSYYCLTRLLEGIQDNYVHAQPGIQRQVRELRDLTSRIDGALAGHLEREGVEFIQFSFRWMNCLLMREVSVSNTVRMWDTYLAESNGFSSFHLYVCAAFLVKWSSTLQKLDFGEIMTFLQALPTRDWTEKDVELLLSEAFIWKSLFEGSKAHIGPTRGGEGERILGL